MWVLVGVGGGVRVADRVAADVAETDNDVDGVGLDVGFVAVPVPSVGVICRVAVGVGGGVRVSVAVAADVIDTDGDVDGVGLSVGFVADPVASVGVIRWVAVGVGGGVRVAVSVVVYVRDCDMVVDRLESPVDDNVGACVALRVTAAVVEVVLVRVGGGDLLRERDMVMEWLAEAVGDAVVVAVWVTLVELLIVHDVDCVSVRVAHWSRDFSIVDKERSQTLSTASVPLALYTGSNWAP
jgi:hypothetical protein